MKLRKRIAALGAAMTMAVSMMSFGASAETINRGWTLRRVTGAGVPSSLTITSQKRLFQAPRTGAELYKLSDLCNNYTSAAASNGDEDYVHFCIYVGNSNGNSIDSFIAHYLYHKSPDTTVWKTFDRDVGYGKNLWVKYNLKGPSGLNASMSGTGTVYTR